MEGDCEKANLIKTKADISSFDITQHSPERNENTSKHQSTNNFPKPVQPVDNRITTKATVTGNEAAEERQRTGRYLAIGVTLIMVFIGFHHTLLRHATVLAGLLAPAIIMLLYILWLFYFAKKKKTSVSTV